MTVKFWASDVFLFTYYFDPDVRDVVKGVLVDYLLHVDDFSATSSIEVEMDGDDNLYQTSALMNVYTAIGVYKRTQPNLDMKTVSELIQSFLNYQANKPISRY